MTKPTGIGRGKGGGPKPKEQKAERFNIIINADRMEMYKEYLTVLEGHAVENKDVVNWVRTMLYGQMDQLDELVSKEAERALIF